MPFRSKKEKKVLKIAQDVLDDFYDLIDYYGLRNDNGDFTKYMAIPVQFKESGSVLDNKYLFNSYDDWFIELDEYFDAIELRNISGDYITLAKKGKVSPSAGIDTLYTFSNCYYKYNRDKIIAKMSELLEGQHILTTNQSIDELCREIKNHKDHQIRLSGGSEEVKIIKDNDNVSIVDFGDASIRISTNASMIFVDERKVKQKSKKIGK